MSIFHLLAADLNNNDIDESAGNTLTLTKATLKDFVSQNKEALRMLGVDVQKAFVKLYKHVSENEGQYDIRISTHWPCSGGKGYHTMGWLEAQGNALGRLDIFSFKKIGSKDVEKRITKMEKATNDEENAMALLIYILAGDTNICNNPRPSLEQAINYFRNSSWIF